MSYLATKETRQHSWVSFRGYPTHDLITLRLMRSCCCGQLVCYMGLGRARQRSVGPRDVRASPLKLAWRLISSSHLIISSHHLISSSLDREGRRGTTDDFATSFLYFSLFSTALWDSANSRPVHSLVLSSHLFLCLPCLLPPFDWA